MERGSFVDTRWRIELLGGLRARQGERTITQFKTRKAEALLACLLLRPDQPCRREELSQMLWSKDEDREALLHRLNIALSELRHILTEPDVFPRNPSPNVCLDPAAVVTDVADFERLLAEAAQAGGVDERVRLLRAATALYRGELMPGYGEEWIKTGRDELAQKHREALGALTQALITAEDFAGALEQAERWVRAAPRDERAHRTLMEVYAALGRTPEALRHYDGFERTLHAEQQAPDPKTQALAERLRASVVRLAPVSALPLAHPAPTNAVAPRRCPPGPGPKAKSAAQRQSPVPALSGRRLGRALRGWTVCGWTGGLGSVEGGAAGSPLPERPQFDPNAGPGRSPLPEGACRVEPAHAGRHGGRAALLPGGRAHCPGVRPGLRRAGRHLRSPGILRVEAAGGDVRAGGAERTQGRPLGHGRPRARRSLHVPGLGRHDGLAMGRGPERLHEGDRVRPADTRRLISGTRCG